jgi:hypothetical protein
VILGDVAHALAHLARFTGHARFTYSVAQHSVLGARQLAAEGYSAGVQRAFLLHDAHEAYTGDLASPVKRCLGAAWADFERRHELAVRARFGAPRDMPPAIRTMDLRMLATEVRDLFDGTPPESWNLPEDPIEDLRIYFWSPTRAKLEFLAEADRLDVR